MSTTAQLHRRLKYLDDLYVMLIAVDTQHDDLDVQQEHQKYVEEIKTEISRLGKEWIARYTVIGYLMSKHDMFTLIDSILTDDKVTMISREIEDNIDEESLGVTRAIYKEDLAEFAQEYENTPRHF